MEFTSVGMRNRITDLFQAKTENILSIFYTAGFPELDDTVEIAETLSMAGVDMIELGMPFSDPIADGPVIQKSYMAALQNGMTVSTLLAQVKEIRKEVQVPILLMGYLNPVLQFGIEKFCKEASVAGVDGVIIPDMPLREYELEYASLFATNNLHVVFLITPTSSEERIRQVDKMSGGFIYAVSSHATTGEQFGISPEGQLYLSRLQTMNLKNKILVGFGISNREMFDQVCRTGAGAIVGSAFLSVVGGGGDRKERIISFMNAFRG